MISANRIIDGIKGFFSGLFGFLILIALFVGSIFLLKSTVLIGETILPFLSTVISWLSIGFFLALIPMGFTRRTRALAGNGSVLFSYLSGLTLWFYSAVITYYLWGLVAIIIGLAFLGVGVLPIALLASGVKEEWGLFWNLAYMMALTYGSRMLGIYFLSKAEQEEVGVSYSDSDVNEYNKIESAESIIDAEVENEMIFCSSCGKEISVSASFCRFCGHKR